MPDGIMNIFYQREIGELIMLQYIRFINLWPITPYEVFLCMVKTYLRYIIFEINN